MQVPLELGRAAWEPAEAAEVEVYDRFNGVPTIGFFTAAGQRIFFWQAFGHVTDGISAWVYVPAPPTGELDENALPYGLVFGSPVARAAVVAVAVSNRLVFWQNWTIEAGLDTPALLHAMAHYLLDAVQAAYSRDLPPETNEAIGRASQEAAKQAALADVA